MMPRRQKQTYLRLSKRKDYLERIQEAENNIKQILKQKSKLKPCILYSGGKDSLVLIHMIMKQDNSIPVFYFHAGYGKYRKQLYIPKRLYDELVDNALAAGVTDFTAYNTPFCDGEDYLIHDFFTDLKKFKDDRDLNLELLGIRGMENRTRAKRVEGPLVREERKGRFVSFPLRYLTDSDIWTYIVSNNISYLSYYDQVATFQTYEKSRWSSLFLGKELFTESKSLYDTILYSDDFNSVETVETGKKYIVRVKKNVVGGLVKINAGGEIMAKGRSN